MDSEWWGGGVCVCVCLCVCGGEGEVLLSEQRTRTPRRRPYEYSVVLCLFVVVDCFLFFCGFFGGRGGGLWVYLCGTVFTSLFLLLTVIIIIYPLTARVFGAPQMISQPVSSIFPCSPLSSGTCRTPGLSVPWCCLPTSSSVCLAFFPLSLCLATWPYHCSLRLFTMVRRSSCGPIACWILARTSSLVTWSLYTCVVSCGSTSFPWLVFFFGAVGSGLVVWTCTGRHKTLPSSKSLPVMGKIAGVNTTSLSGYILIVRRKGPDGRKGSTMNSTATCSTWIAGNVGYLPPVLNLRAVLWFHFTISYLVLVPSPLFFSLFFSFFACWPMLLTFFPEGSVRLYFARDSPCDENKLQRKTCWVKSLIKLKTSMPQLSVSSFC